MSKSKSKAIEEKSSQKAHEWTMCTEELDGSAATIKLAYLEGEGFKIVSATPVSGSFGVRLVIVAKKEVKS